jgi:hypothetical protein
MTTIKKQINMKSIIYLFIAFLFATLTITSCIKEEMVPNPVVDKVEFYMTDINGNDSLITEIFSKKSVKVAVFTDCDIVSVWPGGVRTVMKKKNSAADSLDLVGNPVLIKSDHYSDYGLIGARGLKTTEMKSGAKLGWHTTYTYPSAGQFTLTVVATNHGYDSFDLHRTIKEIGVTVK